MFSEDHRNEFLAKLGIRFGEKDKYFLPLDEFVEQGEGNVRWARNKAFDDQAEAGRRPWKQKDYPLIAAWLHENDTQLDAVAAALERKTYRMPLVASGEDDEYVAQVQLPSLGSYRGIGRALAARAMLKLRRGDVKGCRADLLTVHRLARETCDNMTLISGLVSLAIDATACQGDQGLLASAAIKPGDLAAYRKQLASLPSLPDMATAIDQGERVMALDCVMMIARGHGGEAIDGGRKSLLSRKNLMNDAVDWDIPLRRMNTLYDMILEVGKVPPAKRDEPARKYEQHLQEIARRVSKKNTLKEGLLSAISSREKRRERMGNLYADLLATLVAPSVSKVFDLADEARTRADLIDLGLALRQYEFKHGRFPAKLSALVKAKLIKQVPTDPFSGKPPVYRRTDEGFVLYSVGRNLRDDGGKDNGVLEQDDIVIRYPQPKADAKEDSDG